MRPFRRMAGVMALLVMALLANLSWVQVIDADSIRQRQGNTRLLLEQYNKLRGPIIVGATPIAASARGASDNFYQRSYIDGSLYAAVTGYYSLLYGSSGIERVEDGVLSGNDPRLFVDRIQQLFAGRHQSGGAVSLTLDEVGQRAALAAMQNQRGGVVAIDARTGAVLVLLSTPSFDPQVLAPNDPSAVRTAYDRLSSDPSQPLVNRALERLYTPGTPFTLITAAAALASGRFTLQSSLPAPAQYLVPGTDEVITNATGRACNPGRQLTLAAALATTCTTALAWLGNAVGVEALTNTAEQVGFGNSLSIPLHVAISRFPSTPAASIGIGSKRVRTTVLQLALIAASVANKGTTMLPYLVRDVRGPDLAVLEQTVPAQMGTPMSLAVASGLGRAMRAAASRLTCPKCTDSTLVMNALAADGGTVAPSVLIAYSGSIAVAVVLEANSAGSTAAVARSVLSAIRQAQ